MATNSRCVVELVRKMPALRMLPAVHSLGWSPDETRWKVPDLADAICESPFLVPDGFTTSEHAREAVRIAKQSPNIHVKMGSSSSLQGIRPILDVAGPDRGVFGTNANSSSALTPAAPSALKCIASTDRIDGGEADDSRGNIRRLLGLG